jgi:hypothetical protein
MRLGQEGKKEKINKLPIQEQWWEDKKLYV